MSRRKKSGLQLRDFKLVAKTQKIVIGAIFLLAISGTLIGHMLHLPTYSANALIEIKVKEKSSLADVMAIAGPFAATGSTSKDDSIKYIQYLRSNAFHLTVAQKLKYEKQSTPLVFKDLSYNSPIKRVFWTELFKKYITADGQQLVHDELAYLAYSLEDIAFFIQQSLTIHKNGNFLEIRITSLDARTSMKVVNSIVSEFTQLTNDNGAKSLLAVEKLVSKKLDETRAELKIAELKLIEFKKQNRITITNQRGRVISRKLQHAEEQVERINLKLIENNSLIKSYKQKKQENFREVLVSRTGKVKAELLLKIELAKKRLSDLKSQRELMISQNYDESDWRFLENKNEITREENKFKYLISQSGGPITTEGGRLSNAELDDKINKLLQANDEMKSRLQPLKNSGKVFAAKLAQIPKAEQVQLMLTRRLDLAYSTFAGLQKKLNEIEIQRISLDKKVQVERLSDLPSAIARLNLALKLLFSSLVGIFFGFLMAFLLELLDTTIRHKVDLQDLGIEFMGEIPHVGVPNKKNFKIENPDQLVCWKQPGSLDSILFDFVRSRIESVRTRSKNSHMTITITSSCPEEGKSFVAANLAISLAKLGKKTVLVDCDLRCPSLHAYFDASNECGINDLFETEATFKDILQKNEAPLPDLITSGWNCEDPAVVFSSENFRIFMRYLRKNYEYVILDTPPLSVVPDGAILANYSDAAMLVTRYRTTRRHQLVEAQQKIRQISSKKLFGLINFKADSHEIASYYPYVGYGESAETINEGQPAGGEIAEFEEKFNLDDIKKSS